METIKEINYNTIKYEELLNEYCEIDSIKSIHNRIKASKNNKSIKKIIVLLIIDLIISLFCNFCCHKLFISLMVYGVIIALNVFFLKEDIKKLNMFRDEFQQLRVKEFCELLNKHDINMGNINKTIEYYALMLEPKDTAYEENIILSYISKSLANAYWFILGIIIRDIIKVQEYRRYIIGILTVFILILILIKLYAYVFRKEKIIDKTKALINELKQVEILNRVK